MRRAEAFHEMGPLGNLADIVTLPHGEIDRRFPVEQISTTSEGGRHPSASREVSVGTLLTQAKNSFRESDTVNSVEKLYIGDRMFIRFLDDSHVYTISVKDSSKIVNGESRAICSITYREADKTITQECILRLPLSTNHSMFATAVGKKIPALSQKIKTIQVQRRDRYNTH